MSWRMMAGGPQLAVRVEKHDDDCSLHSNDTFFPKQCVTCLSGPEGNVCWVTIVELENINPSLS